MSLINPRLSFQANPANVKNTTAIKRPANISFTAIKEKQPEQTCPNKECKGIMTKILIVLQDIYKAVVKILKAILGSDETTKKDAHIKNILEGIENKQVKILEIDHKTVIDDDLRVKFAIDKTIYDLDTHTSQEHSLLGIPGTVGHTKALLEVVNEDGSKEKYFIKPENWHKILDKFVENYYDTFKPSEE